MTDDGAAIECLHRNGYYRLSAYWYPFREITPASAPRRSDTFLPDSRFEDAAALYVFDKRFKLLLLDALERVEIAVRVEIALQLGPRDTFAHTNTALLHPNFVTRVNRTGQTDYQAWTTKFNGYVNRSKDEFILHYERKYGSRHPLPIWIAIELWDFGLLSHFYGGLTIRDRQAVAARFFVPDWQLMESWLRSLNYVRNVIAHHGRLWNLNLSVNPRLPRRDVMPDFNVLLPLTNVGTRVYSICCILAHFSHVVNPTSSWPSQLINLIEAFPPMSHVSTRDMGFPADWRAHKFWK